MIPEITHIIASLIANPPGGAATLSVKEAVALALDTRPLRYGLSTEYSLRRYRAIRRGRTIPASVESRRMWEELSAKVDLRMAAHPDEDDFTALEHVLTNDSPSRYFLTPAYAEKLFYRRLAAKRRQARRSHSDCPAHPHVPSSTHSLPLPSSPRFKRKSRSQQ